MGKSLFISEKPSVAMEFAKALKMSSGRKNGYIEDEEHVVTWCVGHLVTMSYPECYDEKYRRWNLDTLPFIPDEFRYEIIENVRGQFETVASLLCREDIDVIYVCTDAGREGEYIYRLVDQMANVGPKTKKRVWIDSQTEEEILRGIREARNLKEYDDLGNAAYLRAKEDYLMGINFSRVLSLKYGTRLARYVGKQYVSISVGRVMTCVLGMIVDREREIRDFKKTPFYRLNAKVTKNEGVSKNNGMPGDGAISDDLPKEDEASALMLEWKICEGSKYYKSPGAYKDSGLIRKEDAKALRETLLKCPGLEVVSVTNKKETNKPPMLYNLAELQNACSKMFKISPDETLKIAQELYEKKLITYPRTDSRVLSSAAAKEIAKNLKGLASINVYREFVSEIISSGTYKSIAKTRYVNDKAVTDHYAIIPTGQSGTVSGLSSLSGKVFDVICKRFISIFYEPAVYSKRTVLAQAAISKGDVNSTQSKGSIEACGISQTNVAGESSNNPQKPAAAVPDDKDEVGTYTETFTASSKVLISPGYLKVMGSIESSGEDAHGEMPELRKKDILNIMDIVIKEGETTPPKRYNSGAMILAMENAGQLIEDEELRAQIKGSGIGTSATRAEILKKLVTKEYVKLNPKTQIYTPTILGEMVYEAVRLSVKSLLDPRLTASWEKGLSYVEHGEVTEDEYMQKLDDFVSRMTLRVKEINNSYNLLQSCDKIAMVYKK